MKKKKKKINCSEAKRLGLKRYFTGIPCSQGHIAERRVAIRRCIVCFNIRRQQRRRHLWQISKSYRIRCKQMLRQQRIAIRFAVLRAYGNKCQCCNEERHEFLGIDHINGGGQIHRKKLFGHFYEWLKRHNYPSGFRILCHNCNQAKGIYRYCPHEREKLVLIQGGL